MRYLLAWASITFMSFSSLLADESYPIRTISVTGTAVMKTTPDLIRWRIQVTDNDMDLPRAKRSNDRKIEGILGLRGELDIAEGDLETGPVSVRRVYKRDEEGKRTDEFDYFQVRRSVIIRQRDLKRFDEFLEKLVATAEMEVNFNFESSRRHELRAETRLKAMQIAKDKAQKMAEVVDAARGKAITVDEYPPFGRPRSFGGNNLYFDPRSDPVADIASGTSAPGAIEVKVTVYVTFELQ